MKTFLTWGSVDHGRIRLQTRSPSSPSFQPFFPGEESPKMIQPKTHCWTQMSHLPLGQTWVPFLRIIKSHQVRSTQLVLLLLLLVLFVLAVDHLLSPLRVDGIGQVLLHESGQEFLSSIQNRFRRHPSQSAVLLDNSDWKEVTSAKKARVPGRLQTIACRSSSPSAPTSGASLHPPFNFQWYLGETQTTWHNLAQLKSQSSQLLQLSFHNLGLKVELPPQHLLGHIGCTRGGLEVKPVRWKSIQLLTERVTVPFQKNIHDFCTWFLQSCFFFLKSDDWKFLKAKPISGLSQQNGRLHSFGDQGFGIRCGHRRHHRGHRTPQAKGQHAGAAWLFASGLWILWCSLRRFFKKCGMNMCQLFCQKSFLLWVTVGFCMLSLKKNKKNAKTNTRTTFLAVAPWDWLFLSGPTCSRLRSHDWCLLGDLRYPGHLSTTSSLKNRNYWWI